MTTRREALIGGGALVLTLVRPGLSHATPETMKTAIDAFTKGLAVKPGKVKIDIPPLVENGNSVPLTVTVDSPMTELDHVNAIAIFAEKNPLPNVANFSLSPRSGKASVSTRIRLGDSQTLIAIAQLSDGSFWTEKAELIVTLPACVEVLVMARALINVPANAKKGEVVEIKVLIQHPMETGFRTGADGKLIPRDIIQKFTCTYAGQEVFSVELFPAVAANPFFAFTTVATESGQMTFRWTDNAGKEESQTAEISVA